MPDKQNAPLSIRDAIGAFIPIENIGSRDYASLKRMVAEIEKKLAESPNMFASTELTNGSIFRSILESIVHKKEEIPRLYTVATKNPELQIAGLQRDPYSMVIEIPTSTQGEVLRIGRFDENTFNPKVDSNTYGIALVTDGKIKAGIAVAPRTGNMLSTAPAVEVIVKVDEKI
ncbi:MAG TPA: hypothetical protein PLV59_02075 [Candidatus Dojkabacteria bacterium]|nr:hypothetical protein [Candidatus Dojkabacteria bacterium]